MNINDNQLNKEIEALKDESSPSTLQARIIGSILEPKKSKHIMTKRILGFGLSTLVVGAIAFGAVMAPRIATASAVQQVRKAFDDITNYHTTTYYVVEGKRSRVSESWFEGDKRSTFLSNPDGTLTLLSDELVQYQANFAGQVVELSPDQLLDKDKVSNVIIMLEPEKSAKTVLLDPSHIVKKANGDPVTVEVPTGAKFIIEGKGDNGEQFTGEMVEIQIMPAFISGEFGIESLRILLKDESLWKIERNVLLNGQNTDRYELKEGTIKFIVFVDPASKLPLLTRQTLEIEDKPIITEVEYDYAGTVPPIVSKEKTKENKK